MATAARPRDLPLTVPRATTGRRLRVGSPGIDRVRLGGLRPLLSHSTLPFLVSGRSTSVGVAVARTRSRRQVQVNSDQTTTLRPVYDTLLADHATICVLQPVYGGSCYNLCPPTSVTQHHFLLFSAPPLAIRRGCPPQSPLKRRLNNSC